MTERKKLADLLPGSKKDVISRAWDTTLAAKEFGPVPRGKYDVDIIDGKLIVSRQNQTPGYKLTFAIRDGEFAGRRLWLDLWLTPDAIHWAKGTLAKLGVTDLSQLDCPFPQGLRCRVDVVLKTEDNGLQHNEIKALSDVSLEPPTPDPFAPVDAAAPGEVESVGNDQAPGEPTP